MISTTTSVICIVDIHLSMEKECSICRKKYIRLQYQRKRNNYLRNWNFDEKSFHSRQQKSGIIFWSTKNEIFHGKIRENQRFLAKFSTSYRKSLYLTPFFLWLFDPYRGHSIESCGGIIIWNNSQCAYLGSKRLLCTWNRKNQPFDFENNNRQNLSSHLELVNMLTCYHVTLLTC